MHWCSGLHVCLCEAVGFPGTGVADSCELPSGCRGWNPGPLEKQPVILTTELSLQSQIDKSRGAVCATLPKMLPNTEATYIPDSVTVLDT